MSQDNYNTQEKTINPASFQQQNNDLGPKPDSHLVWAILITLFCCMPLGIVSIVYSTKVDSYWAMGKQMEAQEASNKAKSFAVWGAVLGGIGLVLEFFLGLFAGVMENFSY